MANKYCRGSVSLLGALLCLMASCTLLFFFYAHHVSLAKNKQRAMTYLCFRHLSAEVQKFSKRIALYNQAILYAGSLQKLTLLFPGAQWVSTGSKNVKDIAILAQNMSLISYLNFVQSQKTCSAASKLSFGRTPYQLSMGGFERNALDLVQLRGDRWRSVVLGKLFTLKGEFVFQSSLEGVSVIRVQEWPVGLFWKG